MNLAHTLIAAHDLAGNPLLPRASRFSDTQERGMAVLDAQYGVCAEKCNIDREQSQIKTKYTKKLASTLGTIHKFFLDSNMSQVSRLS